MIRKTLLGSFLLAMIWALWADDPAASLSQQIRVGYPRLEGFNEIGPDRGKSGYGYEFLQRLALYTDFEYQYLGFDKTWDENLEMLEKGEIDLLLSALKTEERLRKFAFSAKPIGSSAAILTVRAGDRKFLAGDYANWNGIRVGLVRDSVRNQSFTEFAALHRFTYTPVYFDTLESLLLALHQGGRIDAAVTGNLRHVTNEWILATFDHRPFYAAVRRENRKLLAEINAGIDQLETHYPGLLIRLWSKYYAANNSGEIPLSVDERAFIDRARQEGKVFRAVINPDNPPYSYDHDGKLQGILVELAASITERTGLNIKIRPVTDYNEYLREINNPETAVIFDCWYNYAYAEGLGYRLSRAYYDSTISLVRRKNQNHPYQSIAALKDEALLERFLQKERNRGIAVVFFDRLDRAVEAVHSGRQDALLVTTATAEWILRHDERNAFAAEVIPGISGEYAVGIRSRENKLFRAIVSKAADSLSIEEKANVRGKYSYPPERTLSLIGFFYRNPLMAALFPAGLLFLLSLVFGIIIFTRRRDLRNAAIIRKLPVKYVVADRNGAILYHISSDAGGGTAHFRQLQGKVSSFDDFLPPDPAGRMRRAVAGVIDTGFPAQLDFPCEGRKWTAGVVKLPPDLFGVDSAVWVLQDTTELQDARDRLQERAMLMDAAAQIGRMTYFVIDATDTKVKLFPDSRFWPIENDRPIAHRKWLAPEDLEPRLAEWRHFLESDMHSIRFQYRAGSRPNAMRHYELNAAKTTLAGTTEVEIIGNIRDITAEKRHELEREATHRTLQRQLEKLRQAQRERALILNNIHIPIALHDRTGKLLHVNSAAGEMTGKTIRELEETPPFAIFRAEDDTTESSPLHRVIATGKAASSELRIGGRDYLVRAEPITDELEEMVNIVQSAVDVTEIEEAKKLQEMAMTAAVAANRAKSYFLATMSHEIRTPLNAVIGFTELLRNGDISPAEQREYLDAINLSSNALLALINDVLDLSKLEAGQLEINPAPTAPASLFEDIRAIFAAKAKEKGLTFAITGCEGLPELYLDAARMRQILLNLVGNAVKFTHLGGVTLKIGFSRRTPETGLLTIDVSDTGIGIAESFKDRLFLPFTQQHSVRGNRKYGGTGLGLTITKRLLERMGGSLECRSVEGQGSTFTIRLDHVRCAVPADRAENHDANLPATPVTPRQILLVDDVPANLRVLEALLKRLGQRPVSTTSGKQALKIFSCEKFDLVMTDLWMPEMNGAELAAELRAAAPGVPLVAVTADIESESNFNMKLFDAVLTKPVTANKVKALLEQLETRISP